MIDDQKTSVLFRKTLTFLFVVIIKETSKSNMR